MILHHHLTRKEWLEGRRNAIGGSDIAAILGLSSYKNSNPMSVWLSKTGQAEEREVTPEMEWGTRHEPAVKQKFKENHPELSLAGLGAYDVFAMEGDSWASCTPDDLIGDDGILEAKAPGWRQAHKWGDEGTDEAPQEYIIQCQWNMGVTGRKYCYLVPLIGGSDYREYRLVADPELFAMLLEEARRFWLEHVLAGVPPELDGSESTRAYLERKYPGSTGELPVVTAESAIALLDQYAVLRQVVEDTKDPIEELKSKIINLIGENDGVLWPGGKITYKRPKDSEVTDWKACFEQLKDEYMAEAHNAGLRGNGNTVEEELAEATSIVRSIVKDHTTTKVNSRRFTPKIEEAYVRQIASTRSEELEQLSGVEDPLLTGSGDS